ncbi:hypothetical protein [Methylocystis parvus]|uniref:EF-hand domain-containing protein n=1 Tax=Methylocystis parvus TaxID=134 RepID=A0A6B8M516_9HYPH|nr:hypothetical protein [Methylocystis parvus]QGM97488.1 hypothetical protein F7D14_08440 [Methylocystis parvus]WBJ98592.1 hypothetical protein MMG94_11160 [Methylocystis parvus OBBP]
MSIFDNDILSRLGVRVAFAPPERRADLSARGAQGIGDLFGALGYGTLQANPLLTVQWYQFDSQYAKKSGFSDSLRTTIGKAGITLSLDNKLAPYDRNLSAYEVGRLGEKAVEELYKGRGLQTWSETTGARQADVVGYRWGILGGEKFQGESKVGYRSLTGWRPGKTGYQLAQDWAALNRNNLFRSLGKAAGAFGAGVDIAVTGVEIAQQLSRGDNAGAARSGAQFGGRWGGAIGGALAGGALGGPVGAFLGGVGGGFLGDAGMGALADTLFSTLQMGDLPFFARDPAFLDPGGFPSAPNSWGDASNGVFSISFNYGDYPAAERLGPIYGIQYQTPAFTPSQYHPGKDADGSTRLPTIDVAGKAQAVQVENPAPKVEEGFHVEKGKDGYFYKVDDGSHLEKGGDGQYRSVTDGDSLSSSRMTFEAFGAFDNFFSDFGDFLSGFGDFGFGGFGDFGVSFDQIWFQDLFSDWENDWWDSRNPGNWFELWQGPVILDLDGDGIEIDPLTSSNIYFDMAGDGYQHRTAWAGAGDAVLAFDANNDGLINQKNEIVFTEWDPTAASDMQALLDVFDTNHNGKLDSGDAKFSQFKLVLTNANGTQTVQTLAQAGVASIDLKADNSSQTFVDGSTIDGQTSFTRTNGTTGTAASVSLVYEAGGHALRTTTSTDGAGAVTVDNKAYNPDGSLASETISATSADGKSRTLSQDANGDGVIDLIQTETTVANPDGSKTTTLTDKTAGGVNLDRIVTTVSADGKTTTIQRDMDASGNFEQTETLVTATDGSKTDTISNFADNGALITKISHATSAIGLTRTDRFDDNGDAVWDTTAVDATAVNGDGSRTETVTVTNANGSLRSWTQSLPRNDNVHRKIAA